MTVIVQEDRQVAPKINGGKGLASATPVHGNRKGYDDA
jgi:hypothetical protein